MKIMSISILNLAMHQRLASLNYFIRMYSIQEDPDRYYLITL